MGKGRPCHGIDFRNYAQRSRPPSKDPTSVLSQVPVIVSPSQSSSANVPSVSRRRTPGKLPSESESRPQKSYRILRKTVRLPLSLHTSSRPSTGAVDPLGAGYHVTLLFPETCPRLSLYSVVSASFEGLSRGSLCIYRTSDPFTDNLFTIVLTQNCAIYLRGRQRHARYQRPEDQMARSTLHLAGGVESGKPGANCSRQLSFPAAIRVESLDDTLVSFTTNLPFQASVL